MLHNLDFLNPGQVFPPACEAARLTKYRDNTLLFESNTYDVFKRYYKDATKRTMQVLNDASEMASYAIDINYQRLTSVGTSDLICGERPNFGIGGKQDKDVDDIINKTGLATKLRPFAIDMSRYGDTAARVYKGKDGKRKVQILNPGQLFKIVSEEDKDDVLHYVVAFTRKIPGAKDDRWELIVQIHERGRYTKRVYNVVPVKSFPVLTTGKEIITNLALFEIRGQVGGDEVVATGLSDFAIVTMHNLLTSDTCWGHDDYDVLDPILAEIYARLGQIAIILDKHSRPDMYGDAIMFETDEVGQWRVRTGMGKCFPVQPQGTIPGYITWDGQLTACFAELDRLFEQLYKVSEMGPIYESAKGTNNIAYETMKSTLVRPLAKAKRMADDMTEPLKKIIALLSEYEGTRLDADKITIEWFDGLPNDEAQEITKAANKITAGLSTPEYENQYRFGMSEENAAQLAEEARSQQTAKQASAFGGFGVNDGTG